MKPTCVRRLDLSAVARRAKAEGWAAVTGRNAKRPLGFPAGAIPTVDFLLYHLAPFVKKTRVKTHDRVSSAP
jgi:hypothetical protein